MIRGYPHTPSVAPGERLVLHIAADQPPRERHAAGEGVHAATLGLFRRGGTVFSAGTTDWAQVLANGSEPVVARITRNVLDHLLRQ